MQWWSIVQRCCGPSAAAWHPRANDPKCELYALAKVEAQVPAATSAHSSPAKAPTLEQTPAASSRPPALLTLPCQVHGSFLGGKYPPSYNTSAGSASPEAGSYCASGTGSATGAVAELFHRAVTDFRLTHTIIWD